MAKTNTNTSNIDNLASHNIKEKLSLTSDGIVQEQKGDVYISLTVDESDYLMPLICTDSFGNFQKVVRTSNIDDTITDKSDVEVDRVIADYGSQGGL